MKKLIVILSMFLLFMPVVFSVISDKSYVEAFNFNNATGSNLNVTGVNGTVLTMGGTVQSITGKIINGSGFDTSSRLTSTDYKFQRLVDRSHTISFWVKPNATYSGATCGAANTGSIVAIGNNTIFTFLSICQYASGYQWNEERAGRDYFRSNLSVAIDSANWHLLTVTYNYTNDQVKWYYDGALMNTTTFDNRRGTGGTGITGLEVGKYNNALGFNGKVDILVFYNYTMGQSEITELYNAGAGTEPPFSSASAVSNLSITGQDFYTGTALINLTFCDDYGCNSTTNGTIYTPYLSNHTRLLNFTVSATDNGGYFTQAYKNINVSASLFTSNLSQTSINFLGVEKSSYVILNGFNATTSYLTNVTHYMKAGTYNVTVSKTGYFNASGLYTAVAGVNTTAYIVNVSDSKLNITLRDNLTSANVPNFNITLVPLSFSGLTINEQVISNSIPSEKSGLYTITVSANNYIAQSFNMTLVGNLTTNNVSLTAVGDRSLFIYVYNVTSLALLNNTNITIELTGASYYYNITTNSSFYLPNVTAGVYNVSVSADGYETSRYILTMGAGSFQVINAYLPPVSTSSVTFTLKNSQTTEAIEGAQFDIKKRVNNTYLLISSLYSDVTGNTAFYYESGASYSFTVTRSGYATKTFTLSPILLNSYTVKIDPSSATASNQDLAGISVQWSPSSYSSDICQVFTFSVSNPDGQLVYSNYSLILSNNVSNPITNYSLNAYGEVLTSNVCVYNAGLSDYLRLRWSYYLSNSTVRYFDYIYYFYNVSGTSNTTFLNIPDTASTTPLFDKVIVLILVTLAGTGVTYIIGAGFLGASAVAMIITTIAGATGFISWYVIIPLMLIIGFLIVWNTRQ